MKISKFLKGKVKSKEVIRDSNKVVVMVNKPVYTEDKSRFFKKAWEVEKRQLFFS